MRLVKQILRYVELYESSISLKVAIDRNTTMTPRMAFAIATSIETLFSGFSSSKDCFIIELSRLSKFRHGDQSTFALFLYRCRISKYQDNRRLVDVFVSG